MNFHEFPPRIASRIHFLTNGVIWFFAGLNLQILALGWWTDADRIIAAIAGLITFSLGVLITKTRFKIIVGKFISHIRNLPARSRIFSFQKLKHYILLAFMMTLGITLRHYSGLDTFYLAWIYQTMGTTLYLSSYYFFNQYLKKPVIV